MVLSKPYRVTGKCFPVLVLGHMKHTQTVLATVTLMLVASAAVQAERKPKHPPYARTAARAREHPHGRRACRALTQHALGTDGAGRRSHRARAGGLLGLLGSGGHPRDRQG